MLITTRFFPTRSIGSSRAHKVLERNVIVYRRNWTIIVTGFFEPIFYLLGIGFGLGTLVGDVERDHVAGGLPPLLEPVHRRGGNDQIYRARDKWRLLRSADTIADPRVAQGETQLRPAHVGSDYSLEARRKPRRGLSVSRGTVPGELSAVDHRRQPSV